MGGAASRLQPSAASTKLELHTGEGKAREKNKDLIIDCRGAPSDDMKDDVTRTYQFLAKRRRELSP